MPSRAYPYPPPPLARLMYATNEKTGKPCPDPLDETGALSVPIDAYPGYLQRYGLSYLGGTWLPSGKMLVVVAGPTITPEKPMEEKTIKHGKLDTILARLFEQAAAHPGTPQRQELTGGLRVDVLITGERTYLQLSREKVYPSALEYGVTLARMPVDPPLDVDPIQVEKDGRFYFKLSWKTPAIQPTE